MKRIRQWLNTLAACFLLFFNSEVMGINENSEVLIVAQESSPTNLDPNLNSNEGIRGVVWNIYDRLVTFDIKELPNGVMTFDHKNIKPELAESWEYEKDETSLIFHLHKDAKFHDGTPVTAHDVKWSLDRAVSLDRTIHSKADYSSVVMRLGGYTNPDQFIVIDDYTIKIQLPRKDKLALPTLGFPVPCICNSKLAKQHATEKDPWAIEWLSTHSAGGGAFKIESFIPGVKIVYVRNDDWKSGPLPKLKKIIVYIIPSSDIRKRMLEQNSIDVCFEIPLEDAIELKKTGKYKVFSIPIESSMRYLDMNVKIPPFNDLKVRQAIAYAIPYEEIFKSVAERGMKLYGAPRLSGSNEWPQPTTFYTDFEKAKKLLIEANYPKGFKTDLYIDMGTLGSVEGIAVLIQESLKKIGVDVTIHKVRGIDWGEAISRKDMPMVINSFGSWLNYPDYFFLWNYSGINSVFNTMNYQSSEMDKYIKGTLDASNVGEYETNVNGMIEKALTDIPRIPLFQMFLDVALQPNVHGYVFWFFRQLSFTSMYKSPEAPADKIIPPYNIKK